MHFPIIEIQLEKKPRLHYLPVEDSTLAYWTDYYGDVYSPEDRKDVLNSEWFKNFWEGIGDYDPNKGTVKLYSADVIRDTIVSWERETIATLHELFDKSLSDVPLWRRSYEMRMCSYEFRGISSIFFFEDHAYKSLDFVEDLGYYAEKTLYIGNIFDAHY